MITIPTIYLWGLGLLQIFLLVWVYFWGYHNGTHDLKEATT